MENYIRKQSLKEFVKDKQILIIYDMRILIRFTLYKTS